MTPEYIDLTVRSTATAEGLTSAHAFWLAVILTSAGWLLFAWMWVRDVASRHRHVIDAQDDEIDRLNERIAQLVEDTTTQPAPPERAHRRGERAWI